MSVGLVVVFGLAIFIVLTMVISYVSNRVQVKPGVQHQASSDVPIYTGSSKDNASSSCSGGSSSSSDGGGGCD